MQTIKTNNWTHTPKGDPRGYIDVNQFKELWFHTGTACNLKCPFCLEGSKPGDNRLERITLEDVKPYIIKAKQMGVSQFSFTGGEPFVVKPMDEILHFAAQYNPCLVLTNGTKALLNRLEHIKRIRPKYPVSFRISIDYSDKAKHDQGRGEGTYDEAWQSLKVLYDMGFGISIARQMAVDEDTDAVNADYQMLMRDAGIPDTTNIVAFPDFLTPEETAQVPFITEDCMTRYQTEQTRAAFMCASSKMLIKKDGQMRVYACTLVDNDPDYDQGQDLEQAIQTRAMLKHHRCFSCFKYGSSCSEA